MDQLQYQAEKKSLPNSWTIYLDQVTYGDTCVYLWKQEYASTATLQGLVKKFDLKI